MNTKLSTMTQTSSGPAVFNQPTPTASDAAKSKVTRKAYVPHATTSQPIGGKQVIVTERGRTPNGMCDRVSASHLRQ
ncbi:hypothetical protein GCM10017786_53090 [Amycolatopsis deserti]|uniref:Uncharacterized protein n=1 Tax=Amycolatopsis deserti TaxID=185696 RepID=A0ABQ3JFI1_9PSEU|nr:hypothetical protein GCM10017786_53090 [Amycolatopsis deserti]